MRHVHRLPAQPSLDVREVVREGLGAPHEVDLAAGCAQVDYLRAPDREVDFVGRTETFADDLAHVERRLGGEPVHVPHRNKSPHGSYRDYYTDATRAKVAEVYARDLEAFGYTF